jgi:hypothetical protein
MTFNNSRLAVGAFLAMTISLILVASSCGGGGSSSSGGGSNPTSPVSNTCSNATGNCAALTVNQGPAGGYDNGAFTSVTVCQPGTTSCATIDGILVDTGSVGLRLLKSQVSSIALTQSQIGADALVECYPFVDSYMWGPVATADIKISGETASSAPVMLIDDSTTPSFAVPTSCSSYGGTSMPPANTLADLGAYGILGIGSTPQDCGTYCAQAASTQVDSSGDFVGLYYDCSSSASCTGTAATVTAQVPNAVTRFTTDNNGTVISMPAVGSGGSATLTGALYFGIGTQTNNTMPSTATVMTLDATYEQFITTTYKTVAGQTTTNTESYIDSGSNGFFFVDSGIPTCPNTTSDPYGSDWFCPSSTLSLSATNLGANGNTSTASFSVANANTLFTTGDTALSNLGGPGTTGTFDWGLPFFYGRAVYNGIQGSSAANTSGTSFAGPFVAY